MEIEIAIYSKTDQLSVNLDKGSLLCQSISEKYFNIDQKSSLIVMSAVQDCVGIENFRFPTLRI